MKKLKVHLLIAGKWLLAALLLLYVVLSISPLVVTRGHSEQSGGLEAHFIAVGDADSTLFLSGGEALLIDGGNIGKGSIVIDYLSGLSVDKLDVVIGTHPHADHMGGLSEVIEAVKFGKVYSSMDNSSLGVFNHFRRAVEKRGGKVESLRPGASFELGDATVTVLGPQREYETLNNMSLVVRVDYGQTSFLVEGDAQQDAEADMLVSGLPLKGTVLRVGHHGSNDATSEVYLNAVKPKYAVIACGENQNGHPHRRLLELLKKHSIKIYRTDEDGTVVAHSDGSSVSFETNRSTDSAA